MTSSPSSEMNSTDGIELVETTSGSITTTTNATVTATASDDDDSDRMASLLQAALITQQQVFQQKQAELLQHYRAAQANLALQQINYFQTLQQVQQQHLQQIQVQQQQQTHVQQHSDTDHSNTTSAAVVPTSTASPEILSSPSSSTGMRSRRSFSGSGATISHHTRERLKTMIAKRGRGYPPPTTINPATLSTTTTSSALSELSMINGNSIVPSSSTSTSVMSPSSSHFEPYPLPCSVMNASNSSISDFQLRKVNSEPNLKQRIRAKLLNKGGGGHGILGANMSSSPVDASPLHSPQSTAFSFPPPPSQLRYHQHRNLKRCDSDSTSAMDVSEHILPKLVAPSPKYAHVMIPSPSLPNLPLGTFMSSPLDITTAALMAQAAAFTGSPFLSMPSLFKPNSLLAQPPGPSILSSDQSDMFGLNRPEMSSGGRLPAKFDTSGGRSSLTSPSLPIGGYPSLLKQQLRDLVLRRKSLVREEPEDEMSDYAGISPASVDHLNRIANGVMLTGLKTGLCYDSAMSKHQCVCGDNKNHVEHGGRVHSIWARLQERGLVDKCERVNARKAPLEMLRMAHSSTYVTFFAVSPTACLKMDPAQLPLRSFVQLQCGGIGVDSDTYFNDANTQLATRISVGSLVELCSQIAEGKLRNGFAIIRPPGHHAERDQAMGFCFFNNVAIAARHLQQRYPDRCAKIAIIDWDVHHGNGTQLCFEAEPNVLYLSMHRHDNGNFFPGTGAVTEVGVGAGKGYTVNVPFSGDIMGDAEYLAAWRCIIAPVLDEFAPDFILVSAGFDGAKGHPVTLGGYELSPQFFGYLTSQLMQYANGRLALALEGGYDLAAISDSAEECVKVLCDESKDTAGKLSETALNALPKKSAQETIQKVVAIHKKHWSSLTGAQGLNMSEANWQAVSSRFASLTVTHPVTPTI